METKEKIALITGITGQDGSYLSEFLLKKNYKIYGIVRRNSSIFNYKNIDKIKDKLNLKYGDMTDSSCLINIINEIIISNSNFQILEIYNLAAQSHVKISFEIPEYTSLVDGIGTLKILEIINSQPIDIKNKIKFYQASTSELYGDVLEIPQNEKTQFNPQSPYACAKLYSHYLVKNYRKAYNFYACSGILFNHESPRRGENFVTQKIIKYVKYIKNLNNDYSNLKVLKMGNLNSKRDWGHAKDYVEGMWLMLQQDKPEEYVLSMGKTFSIREFIEIAFSKINIDIIWNGKDINEVGLNKETNDILITVDEKYFRPCEVELLLEGLERAR